MRKAATFTNLEVDNYAFSVLSTGKVGIGTSSPSAKLHLSGSNGDTAESALRQSRAGVKIWDQAIDSSGRLQWGYRAANSEGGTRTVSFTLDRLGAQKFGKTTTENRGVYK